MISVIGIDPGLDGAIAVLRDGQVIDIHDMPTLRLSKSGRANNRELDLHQLATLFDAIGKTGPVQAFLERVSAMPGNGSASMFAFGGAWWAMRAFLAANYIPTELVTPPTWRKAMKVPDGKDGSRARASELWPRHALKFGRVKDHGRAEALLIAGYGEIQLRRAAA